MSAVVLAVVVSACGGEGGSRHEPISRNAAVTMLYEAIDSGPSWATARDTAAARANFNDAPGSHAHCGPDYGKGGPDLGRFVCSLRYLDAGGQPQRVWFSENGNGTGIVPMTQARYRAFVADVVAYERSQLPAIKASARLRGGTSIANQIDAQTKVQPRVRGTACDWSNVVRVATPALTDLTPGDYLVAGPGTSCALARVVATALGDSSNPGSAVLSIPDQTTGGRLTLSCHELSRYGPVECAAPGGAVVYVGSYDAPLPPSS